MNATIKQPLIPPSLSPGDVIGVVAPAGPIKSPEKIRAGIAILKEAGYRVKLPGNLFTSNGYLSGSDQERATRFTEIWQDPEVKTVLAARGGYGCTRILPLLNLPELAKTPKILAGFSDISILLNVFQQQTGLVTYHTPMLNTLASSDQESRQSFLQLLRNTHPGKIKIEGLKILAPGTARGKLVGGNLSCLIHLLGTPNEIDWQDKLLFLEDTGEAEYRVDRMLTHLHDAGVLGKIGGLIFGTFSDTSGKEEKWNKGAWDRALELTKNRCPVWGNFPIGHGIRNISLPIGIEAEMDQKSGDLNLIPAASIN